MEPMEHAVEDLSMADRQLNIARLSTVLAEKKLPTLAFPYRHYVADVTAEVLGPVHKEIGELQRVIGTAAIEHVSGMNQFRAITQGGNSRAIQTVSAAGSSVEQRLTGKVNGEPVKGTPNVPDLVAAILANLANMQGHLDAIGERGKGLDTRIGACRAALKVLAGGKEALLPTGRKSVQEYRSLLTEAIE